MKFRIRADTERAPSLIGAQQWHLCILYVEAVVSLIMWNAKAEWCSSV